MAMRLLSVPLLAVVALAVTVWIAVMLGENRAGPFD